MAKVARALLSTACVAVGLAATASAVAIDWTPIGNAGNACDPQSGRCYGAVGYAYNIGTYEVTNAQYAAFLNAVAATDPNGLYNTTMGGFPQGSHVSITRNGILPGSYTYTASASRAQMPVNYLSFYDALRFANWLHNGQPTGAQDNTTTEDGAYTFSGTSTVGARNAGATVFVPTEDEWYKAAYYNALTASYFAYPAGYNSPTACDFPNAAPNRANCELVEGDLTNVGSYTGSASPYGTFDQGGNVFEWTESRFGSPPDFNRVKGGDYFDQGSYLAASSLVISESTREAHFIGFRVAPEPGRDLLLMTGVLGLACCRKRRTSRGYLGARMTPIATAARVEWPLPLGGEVMRTLISLTLGAVLFLSAPASALTIDWVTVGNPGNPADTEVMNDLTSGYGSVSYVYRIAETEVTNAQYAAFLNAVAATDPNGLYNAAMDPANPYGGITQDCSPSCIYSVEPGHGALPVTYMSVYDAMRFANWLHNGQPTGSQGDLTTEDGAYTITASGIAANSITRNPGATIFLPSEDEWYKAAYYSPGGVYFDYPTGTDIQTGCVPPSGDTGNSANCGGAVGDYTPVGSYEDSASSYGTFDQGGNVWEFNETIVDSSNRGLRGGDLFNPSVQFAASFRASWPPLAENGGQGFRVASQIPEPSTGLLVVAGLLGLAGWRRVRA